MRDLRPLCPDREPQAEDVVQHRLREVQLVAVLHQARIQLPVQVVHGGQALVRGRGREHEAEDGEPEDGRRHELELRRLLHEGGKVLVRLDALWIVQRLGVACSTEARNGRTFRMWFWKPSTP